MTRDTLLREEILWMRATAEALMRQCDISLARMDVPIAESIPSVTNSSGWLYSPSPCPHLKVLNTSVAGMPNRSKCIVCGETVEQVST